jgi:hypothetical protein
MTLATVQIPTNEGSLIATLTHAGWSIPDAQVFERILNVHASLVHFGPADGDPVACAADWAAELLCGVVTLIRPAPPVPADLMY